MNDGWLPFEWIAAVRFLREGRMQTLFIVCGVAIGVAVIVFMSAMLQGLQANFINRVLTSQPHIQLIPPNQLARPQWGAQGVVENASVQFPTQRLLPIVEWQKIRDRMVALPEVIEVSPTMTGSVLAVLVATPAMRSTSRASILRPTSKSCIWIGSSLPGTRSDHRGHNLGRRARAGFRRHRRRQIKARGRLRRFHDVEDLVGLVDFGNKAVNTRNAYVAMRTAQSLLGLQGGANTIDITVKDIYAAELLAQAIQASNYVEADSWIAYERSVLHQRCKHNRHRASPSWGLSVSPSPLESPPYLVVSVIQRSQVHRHPARHGEPRGGRSKRVFLLQCALLALVGSIIGAARAGAFCSLPRLCLAKPDELNCFPSSWSDGLLSSPLSPQLLRACWRRCAPASRAAKSRSGGGDPWLMKLSGFRTCANPIMSGRELSN